MLIVLRTTASSLTKKISPRLPSKSWKKRPKRKWLPLNSPRKPAVVTAAVPAVLQTTQKIKPKRKPLQLNMRSPHKKNRPLKQKRRMPRMKKNPLRMPATARSTTRTESVANSLRAKTRAGNEQLMKSVPRWASLVKSLTRPTGNFTSLRRKKNPLSPLKSRSKSELQFKNSI